MNKTIVCGLLLLWAAQYFITLTSQFRIAIVSVAYLPSVSSVSSSISGQSLKV